MNIEESVEYLKNCLNDEYNFKNATRKKDKEAIETLLTAYEKEKEERERIGKLYYEANENCIKYEKMIENQQKEIEELKDIKQKICNEELLQQEYVKENFIHKDKIKAKIEEVKDGTYDAKIVLQLLLEKE